METRLVALLTGKEYITRRIVADIMNSEFGTNLSKNAVIGKGIRLGVDPYKRKPGPPVFRHTSGDKTKNPVRKAPKLQLLANEMTPIGDAVGPIGDFCGHGECKWIDGDPAVAGWRCCGAKAVQGRPYCAGHEFKAINHNPRLSRERMNSILIPLKRDHARRAFGG
jgi:hypothetical protein